MVVATHLSALTPPQTGRTAVEAFFCISGFLITMVSTGRYRHRPYAFLANRFLRIYPTYWVCLGVALAVVAVCPNSVHIHPSLYAPTTPEDLAANVAIFGLTQETASRLLPAAWSLHTELWFYLVIGLCTAARPRLTLLLLVAALAVSVCAVQGLIPISFYGTPLGNADAFFLGSAVWQHRDLVTGRAGRGLALTGFALFEGLAWMPGSPRADLNVLFAAPAIAFFLLGLWNSGADGLFPARFANVLGRLSYPMFLLHWPFGALASEACDIGPG
jgi:peptidoglycan/LPS O-acetylase OafA/YrhL